MGTLVTIVELCRLDRTAVRRTYGRKTRIRRWSTGGLETAETAVCGDNLTGHSDDDRSDWSLRGQ